MNPLNNHRQSLVLGIVLALVLALLIGGGHFYELGLARWFHIVAGVFWIGLLYYFNVAQTPAMADAAADKGGAPTGEPARARPRPVAPAAPPTTAS